MVYNTHILLHLKIWNWACIRTSIFSFLYQILKQRVIIMMENIIPIMLKWIINTIHVML